MQERILKKENNIEEYQKRRINMDDFLQGEPGSELTFSKDTRKFNRVPYISYKLLKLFLPKQSLNPLILGTVKGYPLSDWMQAYEC